LALKRIFDSSSISSLEFEAELSGYLEILRRLLSRLGRRPVVPLPAAPEQLVD
jgi:hypothetical protein